MLTCTSQDWYLGHRILIPAMGPIAVRRMFDQMVDCVSQMILKWDRLGPEHEVSGPDDFSRLTFDVIGLCAMNYRFNCFYAEEPPRFMTAMAEALVEAGRATNRLAIENTLRYFSRRKMTENIQYMHSICDGIIAERRANPRPELDDLLNVMLFGKDPVSGESMSDELISNEFLTFLVSLAAAKYIITSEQPVGPDLVLANMLRRSQDMKLRQVLLIL